MRVRGLAPFAPERALFAFGVQRGMKKFKYSLSKIWYKLDFGAAGAFDEAGGAAGWARLSDLHVPVRWGDFNTACSTKQ